MPSTPSGVPRVGAWLVVVAALVGGPGCGGPRSTTPEDALAAYARALRQRDWETAYALMSASYRGRVPYRAFEAHVEANPAEVAEVVEALSAPHGPPEQTARVAYGDGEALELRREDGRWVVVGNAVDFYDQSTPRAALRSFVRAVERRRWDVVLRLVPNADREGMSEERIRLTFEEEAREEVERLVASLRQHLDDPIEVVGDRATMPYGERFVAQLVREDGVWKIEDPE